MSSLIALFSDKGSPGTTTLALALAASWPRPVSLVECDPAGGDLALRLTDPAGRPMLQAEPGLLTLAAEARRGTTCMDSVRTHAQPIGDTCGPVVVRGLHRPEQGAGLSGLWPAIAAAVSQPGSGDVLADLGRLHPGSPALAVAEVADVLVGVTRGTAEGMLRLRDRVDAVLSALPLRAERRVLAVIVVEDRRTAEAVAAMRTVLEHAGLPVSVAGSLAVDEGAVQAMLTGGPGARFDRSLLARSARALLPHLIPADAALPVASTPRQRERLLASLARSR